MISRLHCTCITHDSVLLAWHEPDYGADLIKQCIVSYRPTDGEWKSVIVKGNHCSVSINKLKPETEYIFKVCCDGEFGAEPESDVSSQIQTQERLSKRFKKQSTKVSSKGNNYSGDICSSIKICDEKSRRWKKHSKVYHW